MSGRAALIAFGCAVALGSAAPARAQEAPADPLRARVDRLAAPLIEGELVVGMTVGVLDAAGPRVFGYGRLARAREAPPDGRTLFEIGSVSKVFTGVLNVLFGLKVRYYNGPSLIRTDLAREFVPSTSSFAYMAVILVQLLKAGATYKEMTFRLRPREFGKTKAFQPRNVMNVIRDILALFWKIQIRRQVKPISARGPEAGFKSALVEEVNAGVGT